jgi:hypothetical protein
MFANETTANLMAATLENLVSLTNCQPVRMVI